MRRALGASHGRLIRQLFTESIILSFFGSVVGLAVAFAITYYLSHQTSIALPLLTTIHLDTASLSWTLVSAIAVGILFGLAPALRISGTNIQMVIKDNAAGMAAGGSHERFRSTLVISEVALACLLLVGAGLLLRSFLRVLNVDLGFNPSRAAAMQTDLPAASNKDQLIQRANVLKSEIDRVSALPGVESVGIADMLPLDRNRQWGLQSVGRYHAKDADTGALVYLITPGYLQAMGMRLRSGRDFSWQDTPDTEPVIMVNEAGARREWPGEDPIGKLADGAGSKPARVIGVIADVRESTLEENSSPEIYVPMTQNSDVEGATLIVRSHLDTNSLASSVLATLRSIDPSQPATDFRPLQPLVDHSVSPRRFLVLLVTIFATLGAFLAALGIYGVISYSVTQKTQEIGVRMALGASRGRVRRDVLLQTLRLAITGLIVGTIASFGAVRLMASLLFATSPWDPLAYSAVAASIIAIALLSGYLPARRASRIQPMTALRSN
jgi:predicted permease